MCCALRVRCGEPVEPTPAVTAGRYAEAPEPGAIPRGGGPNPA